MTYLKYLIICFVLCLITPAQAEIDTFVGVESIDTWNGIESIDTVDGIAIASGGASPTVYESQDFESSSSWDDGFDTSDNSPTTYALDATSKLSGTDSLQGVKSASGGYATGIWTSFAQTEFFIRVEVYIDSTIDMTNDQNFIIFEADDNGNHQGINLLLYYDSDHYEYNVRWYNDASSYAYYGGNNSAGPTISADTLVTLYAYYKGGTGADGEVWIKVDAGSWLTTTGLDLDTVAATIDQIGVSMVHLSGPPTGFTWYMDDILVQDLDPS